MLWILDSRNWISDSLSVELGFRISIVSRFSEVPKPWFPHSTDKQKLLAWILESGLPYTAVPDPDLEIRGGGWGGKRSSKPLYNGGAVSKKIFFPAPRVSVWPKKKGRAPAPGFATARDEVLLLIEINRSIIRFWELPTYPSPKPTLTLNSHLGQNVALGEGWVGSFSETHIEPKKLTVLNTFAKALSKNVRNNLFSLSDTSWPRFQAHRFEDHYIRNGIQPDWSRFCKKDPKILGSQRKGGSKILGKMLLAQIFDDQRKYLIKFQYDSP